MGGGALDAKLQNALVITRSWNSYNASMAEYVLGSMLLVARQFPGLVEAQERKEWIRVTGTEVAGSTVGIFGTGAIG